MITTSNEKRLDLPIMITPKSLEDLDIIFNSLYDKIAKQAFENDHTKYSVCINPNQNNFELFKHKYTKNAKIVFVDGSSVIKKDAFTAISDKIMISNKPCKFTYTIYYENLYVFRLNIECKHERSITYETNGIDEELKYEIFQKIETWIDKYRLNYLIELWSKYRIFLAFILWLIGSILLGIGISSRKGYSNIVKDEMYKIINNEALSSSDINSLIIGVAKIVSNYQPQHYQIQDHPLSWAACLFMLFAIIAFIAPKTTIAYGSSKKWVAIWNYWAYTAIVLIPTSIVMPIIISYFF